LFFTFSEAGIFLTNFNLIFLFNFSYITSSPFEDLIGNICFTDFIKYYHSNSNLVNTVQCLLL